MDIDDKDAQNQNLHIVGEESSTVSPVLHSYSLPKFEFDDSLQGHHLRFDNIVDNEVFLEITSQEDNHWIEEEYSTSVKSTRKNVWSEATSSESVEMLLKSVGQEEKVLEESNRHSSLTNVMDPKGTLESVVLGDKYDSSVGKETLDKKCDEIATESFVKESQEDSSVSKVECGNAGSSQNVENASELSKRSSDNDSSSFIKSKDETIAETRTHSVEKLTVVLNVEPVVKPLGEGGVSVNEEKDNGAGSDALTSGINQSKISEGSEINNTGKTSLRAYSSAEIPAEDTLNKDGTAGNMDINVVEADDSSKNVKGVTAVAHSESNMDVLTDAVVAVESSKTPSPDTTDGVQLPSGTVAASDLVTEDQPRSPILGVSLLTDDNKEKVMGSTSEETFQKQAPEVQTVTGSDGAQKVINFNADPTEQTGDGESGSLTDPKESMTGEYKVDMPDQLQASVDVDGPSVSDTKSIELSQSAKDKHDVSKGSIPESATVSVSSTKGEKNFTFEVNASSTQNINLSTNTVSSVSSHGSQLDPIKLHEDFPVSQPPISITTVTVSKGKSERKPRKKSVATETTNQNNNMKEKTPTRRSRKTEKSSPLLTPPATGYVSPVSNPKSGDMTPISTTNLPILNNSTNVFPHFFTDNQQVQLRAQILVYGSVLSGVPPEEPHMIAAFGESGGGRKAWEPTWHAYIERARGHKAQPNNTGPSTPNQAIKIGSSQSKTLSGISSPLVNPTIPVSSPLWNIPIPSGGPQSTAMPKSDLFGPFQAPGVQNFAGPNPMWLSHGPFPAQWVGSSPVASFNARLASLPITESVKLTTVKESGAPSIPGVPVGPSDRPTVSQMVSPGQTSGDTKSRKRKKDLGSQITTPVSISSKSNPVNFVSATSTASTHGLPTHLTNVDQNMMKTVTRENTLSKIEEAQVQAADAAVHAATAVNHCQNVWSQLESQKSSGLVSDDEAKLASSAVSIAAASSVAKVAAAAAKIASSVAEQARLMADEVFLSNRTESYDQSSTTSIIAAAKEAARRRLEAASAASKHAENLDAIIKAAELAAEAVAQAGKIVTIGNPLSLKQLAEAGPEGYWKSPQPSSQQGHSDKQNVETALNEKDKSTESSLAIPAGVISKPESGSVHTTDVDPKNIIKEGSLVEVLKDDSKKKNAWYAANVTTLKDGKVFVCYTELQSDDGSGKLKEWVTLEVKGTEPPRVRIAHPMTTIRSEGTRKRGRTTLTDYAWCSGDRVDVWVHDCWCEAVVVETNKIDLTSVTVQFPAQGETSVVRSWHVRPTLIWKDGKWIEWSSLKGSHTSEGDTPRDKRHKLGGSPVVEGKEKVNLVESSRHQESRNIPLSSQGITIDLRTINSGLQKKQSRVVFGVPKPGKTQKFMDVSTHRVDDRNNNNNNNNNNAPNDPVKLTNYLMPQASKNEAKEKQVTEAKPKVTKSRKQPVPSVKTLTQKDKSKPSKSTSHDGFKSDENVSGQTNKMEVDSFDTEVAKETKVGETASGDADRNATKVDGQDKSTSELEPRRSVRRIQPTSRLLEGLQSSLTVVSHASQKSHNKVSSKGSSS